MAIEESLPHPAYQFNSRGNVAAFEMEMLTLVGAFMPSPDVPVNR